jgi:hypothetical protein
MRRLVARPVLRSLLSLVLLLAIYYAIPERVFTTAQAAVLSLLILVGGVGLLAWQIAGQARRLVEHADDESVQLQTVLLLAYMGVFVFALGYFFLARGVDGQFAGLDTKTDALYFTVTTLGTVGFGDIHPTGQAARAIVTGQIVFNLVFLGMVARLVTGELRQRAERRRGSS